MRDGDLYKGLASVITRKWANGPWSTDMHWESTSALVDKSNQVKLSMPAF